MTEAALAAVVEAEARAITERGAFRIVLSGGSTPVPLYEELARREGKGMGFARWHVYFGDERFVPRDHPDSNYRMAEEVLLSRVPVPRSQIHRVRIELGEPETVAGDYERTLRRSMSLAPGERPPFDVVICGMGADGHTGSLVPGTDVFHERRRLVTSTWLENARAHRITLTVPAFNAARLAIFLVGGASKAETVAAVLEGRGSPQQLPAMMIAPEQGELLWLLDRAAAARL